MEGGKVLGMDGRREGARDGWKEGGMKDKSGN